MKKPLRHLVVRVHALERMFERNVSPGDVHHVIQTGQVVEDYPTDTPFPSQLILGWAGARPLHVVVADDAPGGQTVLVTVYEPDSAQWDSEFRRRTR